MADDIASLGFAVDSAPIRKATDDLEAFNQEAKLTDGQIRAIEASARRSGISFDEQASKMRATTQVHAQAASAMQKAAIETRAAGLANDNYTAAERNVVKALQDRIAAVTMSGREYAIHTALTKANTAASTQAGQAISLLAGRQFDLAHESEHAGEKIGEQRLKFRALTEAAREAGGPLGNIIQQTGFLTIGSQHLSVGLIASTVAAGALVSALVKLIEVEKQAAQIANSAQLSGVGGQGIQGLIGAAGNKGVASGTILSSMIALNEQVDLAKSGLGSLAALFRANGVAAANGPEDALLKVADLVKNATDSATKFSIVRQAGLPAENQYVLFLDQGGASIRKQAEEAAKLNDAQLDAAKKLEDRWNTFWTNFELFAKKALINSVDVLKTEVGPGFFDRLSAVGNATPNSRVADAFGALRGPTKLTVNPAETVDPEKLKAQLELEKQRILVLGQTASVAKQVRVAEIDLQIAGINGAGVTKAQRDALIDLARQQAIGVTQINAQIDSTKVQAATILMTAGAAAAYTAEQTRLNEAVRNHQVLTDADKAAIHAAAAELGKQVEAAERLKFFNDALSTGISGLAKDIAKGVDPMKALADQAERFAESIIDVASKRLAANVLGDLFSGAAGTAAQTQGAAASLAVLTPGIVAAFTEGATAAAGILGIEIPTAAAALPVAGGVTSTEIVTGSGIAAGLLTAAGTVLWGPLGLLLAAIAAVGVLVGISSNSAEKKRQDQAIQGYRIRALQANQTNPDSLDSQLQLFDAKAAQERAGLANGGLTPKSWTNTLTLGLFGDKGGQKTPELVALEQAQAAEREKIVRDFGANAVAAEKKAESDRLQVIEDFGRAMNEVQGKGFLNDFADLFKQIAAYQTAGVGQAVLDEFTALSSQKIIDDAGLTGDAFNNLVQMFPQLTGVVHESTTAIQKQIDEQQALAKANDAAAKSILDFVNGLLAGSGSTESPQNRYTNAQSAYNTKLALAQGGDADAQASITQDADNLLKAGRDVFASSQQYQDLQQRVIAQLLALPVVATTTDPLLQATRDMLAAINAGNSTQARDATLTGVIVSAINAGNGVATAAALSDSALFQRIDANTDNTISLAEMRTALGGMVSDAALVSMFTRLDTDNSGGLDKAELIRQATNSLLGFTVNGIQPYLVGTYQNTLTVLTQAQLQTLGLSRDATTGQVRDEAGQLLTSQQLAGLGLALNSTAGGLLTSTQLASLGLSRDLTTGAVVQGIGSNDNEGLRALTATSAAQLNILNAQLSSGAFTFDTSLGRNTGGNTFSTTVNNNMLTALNKIVYNTKIIADATGFLASHDAFYTGANFNGLPAATTGTFATGGILQAGQLGLVSEHSPGGGRFIRAGAEPIHIFPGSPSNDNSATVAEIRALREQIATLQQVIAGSDALTRQSIEKSGDKVADKVDGQTEKLASQERQSNRQRKVAA
jgi:hypothetical protein